MHNKEPIEILIAEDEETDAFFIKSAFTKSEFSSNIHLVENGEDVLNFLYKRDEYKSVPMPHIILLDINMPFKNGHDTVQEIKSSEEFRHIPVIMLSSSKSDDDIVKSYANFANAYVPKAQGFPDMMDLVDCVEKFWFKRAMLPQENR